jgi:hypothetical protein
MNEEEWYVTNGDWRMGPLTIDDVVEVLGREHEPGTVLVWKTGLESWTRPELVAELTDAAAARPRLGRVALPPTVAAQVEMAARANGMASPAAPWFRVGTAKFLLMCVVTFGGYQIYWFYQQWRHVQRRGEVVHPALRTLFTGIFCYALFRRVAEDALARGIARVPSPIASAVAFVLLSITWQLPAPWSSLSLLSLVPLLLVQRAASAAALAAVPGADPNTRLTPINWIGVVFGVLILVMAVIGLTLAPPPEPAKPTPAATRQVALAAPQASVN